MLKSIHAAHGHHEQPRDCRADRQRPRARPAGPPELIEPCILAGAKPGQIVLDPFMGSGTTAAVALQHGRQYLGCEINQAYEPLQDERLQQPGLALEAA